jgi:hypothetical protein
MSNPPSPNGGNGRQPNGRFAKGNPGGPGNPHARKAAELRALILSALSDSDLRAIVRTLIAKAKKGEPWAVREVLDRCIGKAVGIGELRRAEDDESDPFARLY